MRRIVVVAAGMAMLIIILACNATNQPAPRDTSVSPSKGTVYVQVIEVRHAGADLGTPAQSPIAHAPIDVVTASDLRRVIATATADGAGTTEIRLHAGQ